MNSFVVRNAIYDGTSGDPNPLCLVSGTVNGNLVFAQPCFRYLMAASAAGQMRVALTALLFNTYAFVFGFQNPPWPNLIPYPSFPASNAVATHSEGVYPVAPTVVREALIGSWSA